MNLKVRRIDDTYTHLTGGAYAVPEVTIEVDGTLPLRIQRKLVIHEVLENYLRATSHDKIEELTDLIQEALDKLEESDGETEGC